jgi:hypothetical protein
VSEAPVLPRRNRVRSAQAWVELNADDPEAMSARWVSAHQLNAGREMTGLKRLRLFELKGPLPTRPRLERLLHASTQFYNPHKERCHLRLRRNDPAPLGKDDHLILVIEREAERRPAAEHWWLHETGQTIEVREAVVWVVTYGTGNPEARRAWTEDLAVARDRRHGLFCNPLRQSVKTGTGLPPVPWMGVEAVDTKSAGRNQEAS